MTHVETIRISNQAKVDFFFGWPDSADAKKA